MSEKKLELTNVTADIALKIEIELTAARINHRNFSSAHEGYAVLLEEFDELWEQVRKKRSERDKENMREECIQIAAMAIKFYQDVCK